MTVHAPRAGARTLGTEVRQGRRSARSLVEESLAAVRAGDREINAFTAVLEDRALASADALDHRRARGEALPPLAGVPFAVKNLFDVRGLPTLAGSRINADDPAAAQDATLVARMEAAGAVLIGTLNMDEYAYGFSTENSHYGATRNPVDTRLSAGGSSGGCAAAVAAGMVPLTLGSDTNGSIRVPSSLCGIFGLKPTFGRLSRHGSYPFVYSLDHLGPFAGKVEDLALCYDVLQGPDPADRHCAQRPVEAVLPRLDGQGSALRVGVLGGYFEEHCGPDAREAVALAASALSAHARVDVPLAAAGRAAAFITTACEGGSLHLPHLRSRYADMEPLSRDRLLAGALLPAAWYQKAQRVRDAWRTAFAALFGQFDVLLTAATPVTAPELGAEWMDLNGRRLPSRASMGLLTQPISCIGLPVVAAPVQRAGRLPIGVQLIAAPWREDQALLAAALLERAGVTGQ